MVQGTASSVGKSLVSAALCRAFARRGYRVAPFKSQNMSNNAAAVGEGEEIGRAQAFQALAAGVRPTVDMNPILLKPETDSRSQVILSGKPWKTLSAGDYYAERAALWAAATAALDRLRESFEVVVIEGAGSPAEINLRESDIVNMAIARYANSPVILVGDIDSGGVFAQFAGTLALLEPVDRAMVRGLVVNKFRGERSLLEPGLRMIEGIAGVPVLGVLPYLYGVGLAEEDAQSLESVVGARAPMTGGTGSIDIAVIHYPRISNFDDFDALRLEPSVRLRFVSSAAELGRPDAIILPGTKATMADLEWLRSVGLDDGIRWLARLGAAVVGICGGYQMLGMTLRDIDGVEGRPGSLPGLGLLPVETVFSREKTVGPRTGRVAGGPGFLDASSGQRLEGYEIHSGSTRTTDGSAAPFRIVGAGGLSRDDGASSGDGMTWGSYLHGIFDLAGFRSAWIASLGAGGGRRSDGSPGPSVAAARQAALEGLADAVESGLDMRMLMDFMGLPAKGAQKQKAPNQVSRSTQA
jgi:adenosylcobyric acid synthase